MNCNNTCGHRPHPCPHRAKTYKPCSVAITNLLLYHYAHLKWGRTTNFVAVGDYAKKVYMNKATKANIQWGSIAVLESGQNRNWNFSDSDLLIPTVRIGRGIVTYWPESVLSAMAAGGVRQPMVFQGTNFSWHDCVLNARRFMLSRGGHAIVERVTHVVCDVFRGSCHKGSKSCIFTGSCVHFDMCGDYELVHRATTAPYPCTFLWQYWCDVLISVVDREYPTDRCLQVVVQCEKTVKCRSREYCSERSMKEVISLILPCWKFTVLHCVHLWSLYDWSHDCPHSVLSTCFSM